MNEVIAVLYYCFWKFGKSTVVEIKYLESDLFQCFTNIMGEIKDGFIRHCDQTESGLFGRIQIIDKILLKMDPACSASLRRLNIET